MTKRPTPDEAWAALALRTLLWRLALRIEAEAAEVARLLRLA